MTPGPLSDGEIPAYVAELGLPGLADIHVHFMPESMQRKVWAYFDGAQAHYGTPWPITYRTDEQTRLDTLRAFGLRAIPALAYPHKPGMAVWLNDWCREFAARTRDVVHCATLYPEPGAGDYVAEAVAAGARLFKMHVQVGEFSPDDAQLDPAWAVLEEHGVPVVIHAGSAPIRGTYTGPAAVSRVLARHPGLVLVVAHLGMPEYDAFADLAQEHPGVHLDTTMSATDFTNAFAPLPAHYPRRLAQLADKVVLGSDFPAIPYPYAHQLQALARLGLGDDWMRKVLWDEWGSAARDRSPGVVEHTYCQVGRGDMVPTMPRTMTVSDSILVAADPVTLWNAIADPTQMPRWSPENTGAQVGHESRPLTAGEVFVGSNSRRWMRWQTRCRVTASTPGERFEFRVGRIGVIRPFIPAKIATWRYTFEATPDGTLVTETWVDGRSSWPDSVARVFDRVVTAGDTFAEFQQKNIATTLAALQADFAGRSISG